MAGSGSYLEGSWPPWDVASSSLRELPDEARDSGCSEVMLTGRERCVGGSRGRPLEARTAGRCAITRRRSVTSAADVAGGAAAAAAACNTRQKPRLSWYRPESLTTDTNGQRAAAGAL